ncbi:MAG: hypothetical protein E7382_06335 [Clostridiales bacterium]|nr:hypothetical protein [Clostridiales bacterium]
MPTITELSFQTKNKDRCNLYIDGEFKTGISLETVMKYRLKVGMEIAETDLLEVINDSERQQAVVRAVNYISKRLKSKREVKDYLLSKGYDEQVVWYAVDKLKEYGYIDDEEYSKRYIESVSSGQGRRLIEYKLMMKGVRKEDIASAYDNVNIDSKESAKTVAIKHLRNKEKSKENLAKTYRYLIGKGFSYEDANFAIDSIKEDS